MAGGLGWLPPAMVPQGGAVSDARQTCWTFNDKDANRLLATKGQTREEFRA
jgi:hypothetical protein